MAGTRVVVDLSDYFFDHRQKSLIFIDRDSIKNVQHLANHICKTFCLVDNFEIFILDAHVPRSECADIIQEGDVLRVAKVTNQRELNGISLDCKKSKKTNEIASDDVIFPGGNDLSGTSLNCKKSKKKNKFVSDDIVIFPNEKGKKRKIPRCESIGDGKLAEEHVSEMQSSFNMVTSEPKKMKKKKKHVNDSHDVSCEATHEGQALKCESKKGKKKKLAHDPKERSEYILDKKDACNENNDFDLLDIAMDTEILFKSDRVQQSTPIIENNQVTIMEHENNSVENAIIPVDELSRKNNVEKLLTHSNLFNESDRSSEVVSGTFCEKYDCIDSGSVKKRRRQRKRKKPKREGHGSASNLNVSKVPVCKHSLGVGVALTRKRDVTNNNNHIRFSDEEEMEKVNKIPVAVEVDESKNIGSACVIPGNSVEVKDSSISILKRTEEDFTVDTTAENKDKFLMETNEISVDYNKDRQMCQGEEKNSIIGGLAISENCNKCPENSVHCESVVKKSELDGIVSNVDYSAHTTVVSSEDLSSKPGNSPNVILPQSKGNRRRNLIIAKGLGATLSQLIRESNKSNKEDGNIQNSKPSESLLTRHKAPDIEPLPMKSKKDRCYGGFPVLDKFPRRGDILAFKILKLNEKYEPTVSGYLEGKIVDCDNSSALVTVKVLGGADELKKTNGKFDIEEEEDDNAVVCDEKNTRETLQLQWNEFIEPRLVFP